MKTMALFIPEIKSLLSEGKSGQVRKLLEELHPADIARGFDLFSSQERVSVFRLLDENKDLDLFEELSFAEQKELLDSLSSARAVKVLDEMAPDERADFFGELSDEVMNRLFSMMKREEVADVVQLLKHKEDSAGGIMTTDFVALPPLTTAQEAIEYLRQSEDVDVSCVYVVDEEDRLLGVASLKSLIRAKPGLALAEFMNSRPIKAGVDVDQEEVARLVATYDLLAIPVVEQDDRLVGIVTVDDAVDVIEEEVTEDIYKMAGTSAEYEIRDSTFKIALNRLPWLLVCLLGGVFVSGGVIRHFQTTLNSFLPLIFFVPVIMAMGGNVGIQSSTIIIRSLATGDIELGRAKRIILKEIGVGLVMGIVCGLLAGVAAPLFKMGGVGLGIIVGGSMFVALTVATSIGTFFPILLKRLDVDPAVAAGPFVTMTTDFTGLLIYLGLATSLIGFLK